MIELYIYYQVSDAHAGRLLPVVRSMQATLAAGHGVGTGLKRRTALATIADPAAAAGAELFSAEDPAQPCGMIVNAAPNGAGGVDALVEVKLATLEQAVHLGSTSGARVEFLPMPYSLDALDL